MTLDKIKHAQSVLKEVIRKTDMIYAKSVNENAQVYLKTENLQITGSFKVRGAYYKISQLSDEEKARGVIACSAGNHAQGVALGATKNGIKSTICLPASAPISKVEATRALGAEICLVKGVYDDAYKKALELKEKYNYTFVHPFNDEDVIAGQGTIGLEIYEQLPDVDAVIVPIGGGGLISGVAYALKQLNPNIKVYGVQAEGAPSMLQSVKAKEILTLSSVSTIADGIAVKQPGDLTFEMCNKYVDDIVSVSDNEIATAILNMIERRKIVAEGAGAVSVAAAMFNKVPIEGKKVVCLVSGGNVDVNMLYRIINRGLVSTGRYATLTIKFIDKPGRLQQIADIIAKTGGNIISINHERSIKELSINDCEIQISIETKNNAHIDEIKQTLIKEGYILL